MTPFTDEDLDWFKEFVTYPEYERTANDARIRTEFFQALLARLEAAERCARWFDVIRIEDKASEPYRDYSEWRKAAGK